MFTTECYSAVVEVRVTARGLVEVVLLEHGGDREVTTASLLGDLDPADEAALLVALDEALTRVIAAIPERIAKSRARLAWLRSDRRGLSGQSNRRLRSLGG